MSSVYLFGVDMLSTSRFFVLDSQYNTVQSALDTGCTEAKSSAL